MNNPIAAGSKKSENQQIMNEIETKLDAYFGAARPWFSKIHNKLFKNRPYIITALLLFGWTGPTFGITEFYVDWWFFQFFYPFDVLIVYCVTTSFFCAFPIIATTAIHGWEEKTFLPVLRDLKQLVTSYTIEEDTSGLGISESDKYERFIRRKIKKCFKFVNHPGIIALSLGIAGFFLGASLLNTAIPQFGNQLVFIWNYVPAFFMVFFGANVIIGITPYFTIMNDILMDVIVKIEPEHPDGLGGLSALKDLAINTTLVVATTTITIPWLIGLPQVLSTSLELLTYVSLAFVPLFVYAILYVFFRPTYMLYRRIKEAKSRFLIDIHAQYLDAFGIFQDTLKKMAAEIKEGKAVNGNVVQSMGTLVELLKDRYEKAIKMKEWPISTSVMSKLVGSIIIPVALPAINYILRLFIL